MKIFLRNYGGFIMISIGIALILFNILPSCSNVFYNIGFEFSEYSCAFFEFLFIQKLGIYIGILLMILGYKIDKNNTNN